MRKYHKTTEVQIVESIGKAIWFIVSLPFRLLFGKKHRGYGGDKTQGDIRMGQEFIQAKWQEIEELMRLGHPSNYARAVLEADKLLDHVLKGLRAPGLTMGDRLKASKTRFSPEGLDAAWRGHKVRNEIVHSSEYEITDFMAREAIGNFKKALEELVRI